MLWGRLPLSADTRAAEAGWASRGTGQQEVWQAHGVACAPTCGLNCLDTPRKPRTSCNVLCHGRPRCCPRLWGVLRRLLLHGRTSACRAVSSVCVPTRERSPGVQ
eukprot:366295-Chlamydomonas_euryale.AAC.6